MPVTDRNLPRAASLTFMMSFARFSAFRNAVTGADSFVSLSIITAIPMPQFGWHPHVDWGPLTCGWHPNCGIGMARMLDKKKKETAPVTAFLNAENLAKDIMKVNDAARGKFLSVTGMALALMKNYDPFKAPTHFKLTDLLKKFDKTFGATGRDYGKVSGDRTVEDIEKRRADPLNFLFIALTKFH